VIPPEGGDPTIDSDVFGELGARQQVAVLLVEDNPGDAVLIEHRLNSIRDTRFDLQTAPRLARGMELLAEGEAHVVLLDLNLPDSSGLDTLETLHANWPDVPVVVLTGLEDRKLGALAIRLGAQDYLPKANVNAELLSRTIHHAIGRQRLISELRKAEKVRRTLKAKEMVLDQLRELTQIQQEFIDVVTHELRTPMTAIRSAVGLLLDGTLGDLDGKQTEFLEMIERNIERLARFSTDVLALSRLDSDRYPIKPSQLPLLAVLSPPVELIRSKAEEKGITVELEEESMAGLQVYADGDAVAQVVANLANNVLAHCPVGTHMRVCVRPRGKQYTEIRVEDDGQGIPADALPRVFDRFYQSERKSGPGYRGSGVGLSVCRSLVEKMGGYIAVDSRIGEGTTFRFGLPTAAARDDVLFGRIAVLMHFLTAEQLADALEQQDTGRGRRRLVGEILVAKKILTQDQVEEVLRSQAYPADAPTMTKIDVL